MNRDASYLGTDYTYEVKFYDCRLIFFVDQNFVETGALHILWLDLVRNQNFPIWSTNTKCASKTFGKFLGNWYFKLFSIELSRLKFKKISNLGLYSQSFPANLCFFWFTFVRFSISEKEFNILPAFYLQNEHILIRIISKFMIILCFTLNSRFSYYFE